MGISSDRRWNLHSHGWLRPRAERIAADVRRVAPAGGQPRCGPPGSVATRLGPGRCTMPSGRVACAGAGRPHAVACPNGRKPDSMTPVRSSQRCPAVRGWRGVRMRITVHNTERPGRPRLALVLALVLFGLSILMALVVSRLRARPAADPLAPASLGCSNGQRARLASHGGPTGGLPPFPPASHGIGSPCARGHHVADFSAASQSDLRYNAAADMS